MNKSNYYWIGLVLIGLWTSACSKGDDLDQKKEELKAYKSELSDLKSKISDLETEISKADPSFARANRKAYIVTLLEAEKSTFEHFLEVRGSLSSRKNVMVGAEASGNIIQVSVQDGQQVRQGQVIGKIDSERNDRTVQELEKQLELASTVFERQEKLWNDNIGSEIQYLEAKNNKESLEERLKSAKTELNKSVIRAPFAGVIEEVLIKIGESVQPGTPVVQLVSTKDMFIEADISEAYVGKFKSGDPVEVSFPSLDKTFESQVRAVGQVINTNNRTFRLEVSLPKTVEFAKPNMLTVLRIKDFHADDAIIVPTNLIQKDNRGEYVYIAVEEEGQLVAKKRPVKKGMTYRNQSMVEGLEAGDRLINEGFRNVSDGGRVKISEV
ncbi:MAG: efflux RND transporter periplasmic adaptor subunit [Cyclobacteriaceae bacterium]|nr:efflux RND transporter periplasmic adaptor subunit [Cyclobacteriaceae bacterium]MCH8517140.1 efflux RND transporter periplasmic adaptor subunit [Cyclobacteriaceae bacterium]